jgi:hypothetical protein
VDDSIHHAHVSEEGAGVGGRIHDVSHLAGASRDGLPIDDLTVREKVTQ